MTTTTNPDRMKEKLLTDIASGVIMQRPRWKNRLPQIGLALLAACIFSLTVLIFIYIFFALRISGVSALLSFGSHGIFSFLMHMPWHLLALDGLTIIAFAHVAKEFSFGWKTPRLPLALIILAAAFVAAWILDRPVNDPLYEARTELPTPLGSLYAEPSPLPTGSGFTHGTVLSVDPPAGALTIIDERTGDITDVTLENSADSILLRQFKTGDSIIVAGKDNGSSMKAFGIQRDTRGKIKEMREERKRSRDK